MYFDSIQQLIYMDGHGAYVWTAFCISVVVMLGMVIKPLRQTKKEFNNISLHIKLQQVNKAAENNEGSDASDS